MDDQQSRSHAEFGKIVQEFEDLLAKLLACEPYGRGPGRVPPPKTHGVYLFTEVHGPQPGHLYVGRVGVTERAHAAGVGHSNCRTRLAGHTRPASAHNQATFAYRLAVKAVGAGVSSLPATRQARTEHAEFARVFNEQKMRVTAMEFRIVAIADDFVSYVFEPYAAFRLATPYNSWATS